MSPAPTERVARTELDLPEDAPLVELDVADMAPPDPLVETLETLAELDAETVLVQRNDRAPQHLYPKLEERGYTYRTAEAEGAVVTAIWRD